MSASILGEVDHLFDGVSARRIPTRHHCPSRGFAHVARTLGGLDGNGGVPYVCTACGHSWS
ncbi:hypothetical protein [Streptomyces sp. NPDC055186]